MSQPTFDFSSLLDTYRDALAPVLRAQQDALKTMERLARYQFAVAGDCLEWSLAQAKTSASPTSVSDLVGQQMALNTSFGEKLRSRAEEFGQIAAETHGTVTKWVDDASAKVSESIKKAA